MDNSTISKDRVLAAIVRVFFKYFVTGIIESQEKYDAETGFEPKNVKLIMLKHYEKISKVFNREAFYAIVKINYLPEEIEPKLREFMTVNTTDMELIRFACRSERMYDVMVAEYKRNFEFLLCGRLESADEHENSFTRCPELGVMDMQMAEGIINEIIANAYKCGREMK
ncbi:MAG: hypothetical protein ACI4V5_01125 [Prevotella sp.]